jgi:serine/threonine protein kinase
VKSGGRPDNPGRLAGARHRQQAEGTYRNPAEALAVAHAAGVVHRDVKPDNLFLVRKSSPQSIKLLDFGISQDVDAAHAAPDDLIIGTPAYMSPERIVDDPTSDQRGDIWSLGITLHELVTGRQPFQGGDDAEVCRRIVGGAPPRLADASLLPPALRWSRTCSTHWRLPRRHRALSTSGGPPPLHRPIQYFGRRRR